MKISKSEFDKLTRRLEFFDTMRNNLLAFSFTAVLAIIGVALAEELDSTTSYICLIPFFLIIPFSARISYYRLASAHINSFLKKFDETNMHFEIGSSTVTESKCGCYRLIAWLINHEMFLLSCATSVVFYLKFLSSISAWSKYTWISLTLPIILSTIVFVISNSTYNYSKMMERFNKAWCAYDE